MICCKKVLGCVLLLGAMGLGAASYVHHYGCPLSGCGTGSAKCCDQQPGSPGESATSSDDSLVKKSECCPSSGCCTKGQEKAYWTSLVTKASKDDDGGCCGSGCCGEAKEAKKAETTAKK